MTLIIDNNFYIVRLKNDNINNLPEKWKIALLDIANYIKNSFDRDIVSLFIRGSVEKGKPIDNLSDMDITILFKKGFIEYENMINDYKIVFLKKFGFIRELDFSFSENIDKLLEDKKRSFYIKYDSFCIFGEDLSFYIPNFKFNYDICFYIKDFIEMINSTDIYYFTNQINKILTIKALIRASYELCMIREKLFVRDIELCAPIFIKYYPQKEKYMNFLYKLFQENMYSRNGLIFLDDKEKNDIINFVMFIIEEYNKLKNHE